MTDDPQFKKSEFENVLRNLLKSKPSPKKAIKASKKTKAKMVMIAATARIHQLVVATRNERDFAGLGLQILNPFKAT
jgi:predicted nucleic acid-binding protein